MVEPRTIRLPLSRGEAAELSAGDNVLVSGQIVTGRDKIHQFLFNEKPEKSKIPFSIEGGLLYHCGPIVRKDNSEYRIVACGPTTSARVEMYEAWVIQQYGIRAIMGKGGMGDRTLDALQSYGAVYLHTIGGAAAFLAERVKTIVDVWKLKEFGIPEAMWLLDVEDFPAVVTMDAHGKNLHETIRKESEQEYRTLLGLRQ